jgi:hypothetical protein
MTLQEAKSIARHLGLTLRKVCSGHYRVLDKNIPSWLGRKHRDRARRKFDF